MSGRTREVLTLADKIKILEEVDKHVGSRVELARRLNLPITTLNTIVYKRAKIELNAAKCGPLAKKRSRIQEGKHRELETLLLEFFNQSRASNMPISGPILMEQAKELALKLEIDEEFVASSGWLHKFKKRNGISQKMISGESAAVNDETVDVWKKQTLPALIQGYEPRNVFNADETGLFYKLLLDRTLAMRDDKCFGGKRSKERVMCYSVVMPMGQKS